MNFGKTNYMKNYVILLLIALSSCTAAMVTKPESGDIWSRDCYKKTSAPELVTIVDVQKTQVIFKLNNKLDSLPKKEFKLNYIRYQLAESGYVSCRYCTN
jgi:hypothetical protein